MRNQRKYRQNPARSGRPVNKRFSPTQFDYVKKEDRTLLVSNIHHRATKEEIEDFFYEKCGDSCVFRFANDTDRTNSCGIGFIEFSSFEGYQNALKLNSANFLSMPLIIKQLNPEKIRSSRTNLSNSRNKISHDIIHARIGGFSQKMRHMKRSDVIHIFSAFGPIANVNLTIDERTDFNAGWVVIQFEEVADAIALYECFNGLTIDSARLTVGLIVQEKKQYNLLQHQPSVLWSRSSELLLNDSDKYSYDANDRITTELMIEFSAINDSILEAIINMILEIVSIRSIDLNGNSLKVRFFSVSATAKCLGLLRSINKQERSTISVIDFHCI